jgi:hypothetical protein
MTEEVQCVFCDKPTEWFVLYRSRRGFEKFPLCPPCMKRAGGKQGRNPFRNKSPKKQKDTP